MKRAQIIEIGKFTISSGGPVFIIAEAGVNHNGKVSLAKKLVDAAKASGADAVKFQNFKAEDVTTANAGMAEYQKRNTGKNESQIDMIRKFELADKDFIEIAKYCKKRGIMFLSTPHSGFDSVDLLVKIGVPAFKFGSADLTNLPTLAYAAKFKKPIIIATGMATEVEVAEGVSVIRKAGNNKVIVFQCTTDYPAKLNEVNLRAMQTMGKKFDVVMGYSDHTHGSQVSIMAVTLGAAVIEKHLTLDNNMEGPDHKASANPEDFTQFVKDLRNIEVILGSTKKTIAPSARQYIPLVQKSIVARRAIKKGERFTRANVAIKRPAGGLLPKFYWEIVGKRATRNLKIDDFIKKVDYV